MRDDIVAGRVLFRRESQLSDVLGKYRSSRVLIYMVAFIFTGCAVAIATSRLTFAVQGSGDQGRLYIAMIAGFAALFLLAALVVTVGNRGATVITDAGIWYGGMFERWAEIRYCTIRKTKWGLTVLVMTKRQIYMYFRSRDSETVEKLFRSFCSEDVVNSDYSGLSAGKI